MMDHSHDHAAVDGPWAGGWLVALVAGIIGACLARWMGAVGPTPAVLIGLLCFAVYGVLLGSGGVELSPALDDDHGHH